ncbi:hypothetical protein ABZ379_47790 [Streptomyces canus]|uniref:hypothetical protein n=1 Tax=Streptomyces canus TaxID=58343 RepID=UPI0033E5B08B
MDINKAIVDWLVKIVREVGDPSSLHDHAQNLTVQANLLRDLHTSVNETAGSVVWEGPDADAYRQELNGQLDLLTHTANVLESTGAATQEHADKAWTIVKQVIGIILEILEILAVGMLLSWLGGIGLDWVLARVLPLMERILEFLAKLRSYLAEFTQFLRAVGGTFSPTGARIGEAVGKFTESLVIDTLPAQTRAYPGFYIALAVPKLLSGKPVDWKGNAWQLGVFFGLDTALGLTEGAIKDSALGGGLRALSSRGKKAGDAVKTEEDAVSAAKTPAKEPGPATGGPTESSGLSDVPSPAAAKGSTTTGTPISEEHEIHVPSRPAGESEAGPVDMPELEPLTLQNTGASRASASSAEAPAAVTPARMSQETASTDAPQSIRSAQTGVPPEATGPAESLTGGAQGTRGATSRPEQEAQRFTTPVARDTPGTGARTPPRPQGSAASDDGGITATSASPSSTTRGTHDIMSTPGAGKATVPPPEGTTLSLTPEAKEVRLDTESHAGRGDAARLTYEPVRIELAPPRSTEQFGFTDSERVDMAGTTSARPNASTSTGVPDAARAPRLDSPSPEARPKTQSDGADSPNLDRDTVPGPEPGLTPKENPAPEQELSLAVRQEPLSVREDPPVVKEESVAARDGSAAARDESGPMPRVSVEPGSRPAPPVAEPRPGETLSEGPGSGVSEKAREVEAILNPGKTADTSLASGSAESSATVSRATTPEPRAAPTGPAEPVRAGAPAARVSPKQDKAPTESARPTESPGAVTPTPTSGRLSTPSSGNPASKITWNGYKGQKLGEAVISGLIEGTNVTLGNLMTNGIVQKITGVHLTAGEWAFELLGGGLAFARHGIYKWSAVGEKWAYRNQPEGAPAGNRWINEIPISWSYYAMYLTTKDAVKNGVFNNPVYTELDQAPSGSSTPVDPAVPREPSTLPPTRGIPTFPPPRENI